MASLLYKENQPFFHYCFDLVSIRTRLQPIRTASEIEARITIPVEITSTFYKKFSEKAKQLHMTAEKLEAGLNKLAALF